MKNKRQYKSISKGISKWYFKRNRLERTLVWSFLALFIISLIFTLGVQAWNGYQGKYIDSNQCVSIAKETILELKADSYWQIILIELLPVIKALMLMIGLAWILHGVQVRLLA